MPIIGISSIWYPVADWGSAKAFYTETLGLRLLACDDAAGWASLEVGMGGGIPFFLVRNLEKAGCGGGAVLGLEVTDSGQLLAQLKSAGARIDEHIQEGADVRIHTVYDPDGNAIELSEAK